MVKKLQLLLLLLFVISLPLAAQHTHIELSYRSFRPFIHFQLNVDAHQYDYQGSYESAYLKGYMDGVNDYHYYRHRFDELVWDIDAYEAGYRDGFRDHELLIRLRGRRWYRRHRFTYNDYYAPTYSVRIWLDGLSLAFLQAPARQLPHRWKHRVHPYVIRYRNWMARRPHHKGYDAYYSSANVERRFKKRIRGYRKQAYKIEKRHRKVVSHDQAYKVKQRHRQSRAYKSRQNKQIERSKARNHNNRKVIRKHKTQRRKEAIKRSKERKRTRSTVTRKRVEKKSKSKRSRGRNSRERQHNG